MTGGTPDEGETTMLHPRKETFTTQFPAVAGATDDKTVAVCVAPFAGVVESVSYTPNGNSTSSGSSGRTYTLTNKKLDGNGTTQAASVTNVPDLTFADFDEKALTLSGTAANLVVAAGDVLAFTSTHIVDGAAEPGGLVTVTIAMTT